MQRTPPHCGWRFFIPMSAAWDCNPPSAIRVPAPRTTATAAATTDSEPAARTERKPPRACIRQPDRMCSCIFPYRRLPLPHRQRHRITRRKTAARRDATTVERQRIPPRNARPTKDSGTSGHAEFSSIIGRITPFDSFSIGFQRDFDRLSTILSTSLLITPTVISGHCGCGTDSVESSMSAEERTKKKRH